MRILSRLLASLCSMLLCGGAWCQGLTPAAAEAAFQEAKALSDADDGKAWGLRLYGPMVFVDPSTGIAVSNEPDRDGVLHPDHSVFTGRLPETLPVANTAIDWEGKRWTMVQWPLPESSIARDRLLAHEMFHRIEPALGIPTKDAVNVHLDAEQGRVWTLLEWRALAAALVAQPGPAQDKAVADALLFRRHRQELYAGSAAQENALELNEGLAEYTGVLLGEPDRASAVWHTVARLSDPAGSQSLVRSFAYTSGPAYGLLLDIRCPGWRRALRTHPNLTALLAVTSTIRPGPLGARATVYGSEAIEHQETEREEKLNKTKATYRALLIDGPTLMLPILWHFNFSFDPGELTPLTDQEVVYPTLHASDDWGSLEVTQGALVSFPKQFLRVAASVVQSGKEITGPGWSLKLAPGWQLQPGLQGSYTISKISEAR